jgi:hypothetical protein
VRFLRSSIGVTGIDGILNEIIGADLGVLTVVNDVKYDYTGKQM